MTKQKTTGLAARVTRYACAAFVLAAAGATMGRAPAPADASPPTAIELADHALTSSTMLADESPYELIDPVGPGGITRDQARDEVSASTMIGGLVNDGGRGYSAGSYFMPAPAGGGYKP